MKVFAHRGMSAYYPENSRSAIAQCHHDAMSGIEIDVFQANDEFVIAHDRWLTRTIGIHKKAIQLNKQELSEILAKDGQPIATLPWVIETIKDNQLEVNLELKNIANIELFYQEFIRLLTLHQVSIDRFIVSSFNHNYLLDLHKLNAKLKLGLLLSTHPVDVSHYLQHFDIYSVHLDMDCISAQLINDVKKAGYQVFVFTVDNECEINWLLENGVNGIFANDPVNAGKVIKNFNNLVANS